MRQFRRQAVNRGIGYFDKAEPGNSNCFQIICFLTSEKYENKERETQHVFPFPINQHQDTHFLLLILLFGAGNCTVRGKKDEWETKD